ncbi:hypothetical protein [Xanthomonas sp. NCPPB 1128]|nr:hypothetical protein [Xanthomonas sp. NCPPB 1128]
MNSRSIATQPCAHCSAGLALPADSSSSASEANASSGQRGMPRQRSSQ